VSFIEQRLNGGSRLVKYPACSRRRSPEGEVRLILERSNHVAYFTGVKAKVKGFCVVP